MRRLSLFFLSLGVLLHAPSGAQGGNTSLDWGTTAVNLGPAWTNSPSLDALLADQQSTVSLKRFYRAGGENVPATPTECRVAFNADTLFVVFRCSETNLSFPVIQHGVDWYSKLRSPSEQDAAFPDQVHFLIQPDSGGSLSYYHFAVTLDGLKFGAQCNTRPEPAQADDPSAAPGSTKRIDAFEATVNREQKEWKVFLRIPWKTIGGKPASCFGFIPMRTRWRNGEVSSPVAMDFAERPPLDLFIETHFSTAAISPADACLCQLPSGTLRWQRPALLSYPAPEDKQQIWHLQQSLAQPTNEGNLAQRVQLTQMWLDLLTLEGFNPRTGRGSIVEEDLTPFAIRRSVNAALRGQELPKACQLLDAYLGKLDKASRKWFADGSPGNILNEEWIPVSEVKSLDTNGAVLVLHCLVGDRTVDLHLSLPRTGGLRLYGQDEGHFKPDGLLPLKFASLSDTAPVGRSKTSLGTSRCIATPEGRIVIDEKSFAISCYGMDGNTVTWSEPGGLAFRFSPEGKVLAVDFKHHLDTDEALYGFGEKFDRFNEHGNVLTLWGMDDWTGLTVGLRNESYKPVPVFHSSKGYSVFVNSSYRLRADIGKTRPDQSRLTQHGSVLDYYFWVASPEAVLQSYTALTGKPFLPPKWAFESWMGRTGRGWNNTPLHDPVAEEERVVERFAALDIPHSAIYSEGSGADSPALHAFMAARGLKVLSWYYSAIPLRRQQALLPGKTPEELPLLNIPNNQAAAEDLGYVDFSNPNALELCRRWWEPRLSLGVAGSMVDFGDRVPEEAVFYDGRSGDEMHNSYAYDYQRTYYEVFHERRGEDFILFGRAAAPGTQRWAAQFAGDHPANFSGLQAVLTGALNLSACGFSFWGSDLGGFLGWPEPAVYMRWTQFACFSPLMRSHGRTPREPWEYGEAALANYKRYAWVRENLLDYIYDAAIESHKTGMPLMRSMPVAYPHETALASTADEYMFGSQLLVAPVIDEGDVRTISFPPGTWTSLWDGRVTTGPGRIRGTVALGTIPVYLKEGAVVPVRLSKDLQFGASMTGGHVSALVVTPPREKGEASLANARNEPGRVSLLPSPNGFTATLANLPEMLHLLVCGASVREVKADGEVLPKLAETAFDSGLPGWRAEPATLQVAVRLPPLKAPSAPAARIIELRLNAAPSTLTSDPANGPEPVPSGGH